LKNMPEASNVAPERSDPPYERLLQLDHEGCFDCRLRIASLTTRPCRTNAQVTVSFFCISA
jgi:hypothetical protein